MAGMSVDPAQSARLLLSLRRQGITDDGVLSAVETVSRAGFCNPGDADLALEDCSLPIPCGQSILPPATAARLLQATGLGRARGARVFLVGAGSGWMAALLARMGAEVLAAERFATLVARAEARLEAAGQTRVRILHADGLEGPPPETAPYDVVLLTGTVSEIPAALTRALRRNGRLVAPRWTPVGGVVLDLVEGDGTRVSQVAPPRLTALRPGLSRML